MRREPYRWRFSGSFIAHLFKATVQQHHRDLAPTIGRFVPPAAVVFDIGAHAGQYTKLFARAASRGRVYAFEPGSYARAILRAVVAVRRLANVAVMPMALGGTCGVATLSMPIKRGGSFGFGLSHLGRPHDRWSAVAQELVGLATLDAVAAALDLDRLDLIKADIEGSELALLRGGEETLRRFRPILVIELGARIWRAPTTASRTPSTFSPGWPRRVRPDRRRRAGPGAGPARRRVLVLLQRRPAARDRLSWCRFNSSTPQEPGMTRPFEGIRIIDITHVLAGPFAAYQLAVLGADVIKVEDPERPRPEPRKRHRPSAQPQPHGHVVPDPGLEQALDHPRPEEPGGPRDPEKARRARRCAGSELPAGRVRGAGPRLRGDGGDQPAPCLLLDLRIRTHWAATRAVPPTIKSIQATSGLMAMTGTPKRQPAQIRRARRSITRPARSPPSRSPPPCFSASAPARASISTSRCSMSR